MSGPELIARNESFSLFLRFKRIFILYSIFLLACSTVLFPLIFTQNELRVRQQQQLRLLWGKSVFDRRHWLLYRSVQSRLGGSRRGDSSGNKGLDGKKKKKSVQAASWTKAQIWWSRLGLTTWATSRGGTRKKKIGAVRMSMPQWRPGIKKEEEKE